MSHIAGYKYFKALIIGVAVVHALPAAAEPLTGPFIGVKGGWGDRSGRSDLLPIGLGTKPISETFNYSVVTGFDYLPMANVVVGIEGEIGSGGKRLNSTENGRVVGIIEPHWNYAGSIRLGRLIKETIFFYGRAGYAAERITSTFEGEFIQVVPGPETRRTNWSGGLLLGAGLEYVFMEKLSFRAEYQHRDMRAGYSSRDFLAGFTVHF